MLTDVSGWWLLSSAVGPVENASSHCDCMCILACVTACVLSGCMYTFCRNGTFHQRMLTDLPTVQKHNLQLCSSPGDALTQSLFFLDSPDHAQLQLKSQSSEECGKCPSFFNPPTHSMLPLCRLNPPLLLLLLVWQSPWPPSAAPSVTGNGLFYVRVHFASTPLKFSGQIQQSWAHMFTTQGCHCLSHLSNKR